MKSESNARDKSQQEYSTLVQIKWSRTLFKGDAGQNYTGYAQAISGDDERRNLIRHFNEDRCGGYRDQADRNYQKSLCVIGNIHNQKASESIWREAVMQAV